MSVIDDLDVKRLLLDSEYGRNESNKAFAIGEDDPNDRCFCAHFIHGVFKDKRFK